MILISLIVSDFQIFAKAVQSWYRAVLDLLSQLFISPLVTNSEENEEEQAQPGIESLRRKKRKRLPRLSQRDFLRKSKHYDIQLKEKMIIKAQKSTEEITIDNFYFKLNPRPNLYSHWTKS